VGQQRRVVPGPGADLEGYPAPLVLLSFVFVAATLFALVVMVGAYLRVVARRQTTPPAWLCTDDPTDPAAV